jgi:hypothetical protein
MNSNIDNLKDKFHHEDIDLLKKMISASSMSEFTTLPNFKMKPLSPPSGYISSVNLKSTFQPDMFMNDLYEGITIKALPSNIDFSYLNKKKIKEVVHSLFGNRKDCEYKHPSIYGNSSDWVCEIRGENNFVGIYCCKYEDNITNELENKWFIACKSALPKKTYFEYCDYLDEQCNNGITYEEFLEDKKNVLKRLKYIAEDNRKRIIFTFCSAIGIPIQSRISTKDTNIWDEMKQCSGQVSVDSLIKAVKSLYNAKILGNVNTVNKYKVPIWFKHQNFPIGACLHLINTKNKAAYERVSKQLNIVYYKEPYVTAGCDICCHSNFFNENNTFVSQASNFANSYGALTLHHVNTGNIIVFGLTAKHSAFFKGSAFFNSHENTCPTTIDVERKSVSSEIRKIMKTFGLDKHKLNSLVPLIFSSVV